ncbi:UNVERIFIED_CONTAM: hypothetical protein GTU68_052354 [Idotea baltica]|nr:hypothetical protein [Idotea baltica]
MFTKVLFASAMVVACLGAPNPDDYQGHTAPKPISPTTTSVQTSSNNHPIPDHNQE